jgi:prefoldin subunit 5
MKGYMKRIDELKLKAKAIESKISALDAEQQAIKVLLNSLD